MGWARKVVMGSRFCWSLEVCQIAASLGAEHHLLTMAGRQRKRAAAPVILIQADQHAAADWF